MVKNIAAEFFFSFFEISFFMREISGYDVNFEFRRGRGD